MNETIKDAYKAIFTEENFKFAYAPCTYISYSPIKDIYNSCAKHTFEFNKCFINKKKLNT